MKPCHWWIIIVQTKKFGEFTPLAPSKFILHHLPDFILESFFIVFNLKNLTDFRKTMKTRADPHLSNGMSNQKAGWRSQVQFCWENLHFLFRVTYAAYVADWKDIILNEKHNKY